MGLLEIAQAISEEVLSGGIDFIYALNAFLEAAK